MSIKKCIKCYPKVCHCQLTPDEIISSRTIAIQSNMYDSEEIAEMEEEIREATHQLELSNMNNWQRRKTIRAKMKDDLINLYCKIMPYEFDAEIGEFLNKIDGKEVTLVFTEEDAFEINDDNIWLPKELWDEIK